MTSMFKPMLSGKAILSRLSYPCLVSPKLDGVRAIVINGVVMSRNLKPIPNAYIQKILGEFEYYDGELIVGDPTDPACYRNTVSGVMSMDGEPKVKFWVFLS